MRVPLFFVFNNSAKKFSRKFWVNIKKISEKRGEGKRKETQICTRRRKVSFLKSLGNLRKQGHNKKGIYLNILNLQVFLCCKTCRDASL